MRFRRISSSQRLARTRCASLALLLASACTGEIGDPQGVVTPPEPPGSAGTVNGGGPVLPSGGGAAQPTSSGGLGGATSGGSTPVGGQPPGGATCLPGAINAAPAKLRRLTPEEYANTARDLLGNAANPELEAQAGEVIGALEVEKLNSAAHDLAALGGHHDFVPCSVDGAGDDECASTFIRGFGERAFRRPLSADEQSWLEGVYAGLAQEPDAKPAFSFKEKIDAVAEVILQSPQHLYVHELGVEADGLPAGVRRLSGYERATRLSYLMWGSTPDPDLMAAAANGALDSASGVRVQAERLLASPRARQMVRRFASRWLGLDAETKHPALEDLPKSSQRFPFDNASLRAALRTETEALYERAFFTDGASFETLLTSRDAYVNADLAALYGVTFPRQSADFAWVELPANERAGLFTRAAFLSAYATADYQSPIRRGVFMLRKVLCQALPDPPPTADNTPPAPSLADEPRTIRELTEIKTSGGSCTSCHSVINPFGFAFEHYGALGQFQREEAGTFDDEPYTLPVDSSAEVNGGDVHGAVSDAIQLSTQLAESALAHDCAVEGWFERALARRADADDACWLEDIKQEFRKSSNLQELLLALASSDAALHIKETTP